METETLFSCALKSLQIVNAAMKFKNACSLKKSYDIDSILKSRDITFVAKVHIVKAMFFPVVIHGCESQTL